MAGIARENVSRILNDWMRAQAGEPARRLLLPGKPRRAGARSRDVRDLLRKKHSRASTTALCDNPRRQATSGETHVGRSGLGRASLSRGGELGEAARRLESQRRRRGRGRQQGPRLRVQSRRAPDDGVRPRRQLPALAGARACSSARTACTSTPDDTLYCTDDGDHTVRKCTTDGKVLLDHRHPGQARAVHERRAVPSLHAHGAVAQGRDLRLRRLRQRARAQVLARRQAAACPGASPAPIPGSSTSCTTSPPTPTAGSTSPTARTIACRCSTATASTRRSGTTCTGPAGCAAVGGKQPNFIIGELGPGMPVNLQVAEPRAAPHHRRRARASASRGSAARTARASSPASSSRRTASRSTRKGDIYVGEVGVTNWKTSFPDTPMPKVVRCLQKLEKVAA